MKRKSMAIKLAGFIVCLLTVLSGCSSAGKGKNVGSEDNTLILDDSWKKNGFRTEERSATGIMSEMENPILHEAEYHVIVSEKPDFDYKVRSVAADSFQDRLYIWSNYELPENTHYTLQVQSVLEDKGESREVVLPDHIAKGYALKLDVLSEDIIGILFIEQMEQEDRLYCLKADREGNLLGCVLLDIESGKFGNVAQISGFYVDAQGYSYLLGNRGLTLYVFDSEGALCLEQTLSTDDALSCSALHMPDGSLVFYVPDQKEKEMTMLWLEMPAGKQKELAKLKFDGTYAMTITEAGDLYLLQTSRLLKWNVVTGKQEVLFNCLQSDMELHTIKSMEVTPEGKVLLYQSTDSGRAVCVLSDEEVTEEEAGIILANLSYTDSFIKAQTTGFTRKNPDIPVIYETGSGDAEDYRNQVMAQLVAGKGPQLLWVNAADMQMLQEKGALLDLREVVSGETLQQIFPGIVESGTVNGTLVGLYFDAYACALMVNSALWPESGITSLDMVELAKNSDTLQGLIGSDLTFSKSSILSIAALGNMENSPFFSPDRKESRFNRPEFVELLTLVNQYGDNPKGSLKDMVKNGDFLAYRITIEARNLPVYSELMEEYGDACHLIGYPNDTEYQGFWPWNSFLVVNAKADNQEAIGKFFEYLLSREAQQKVTLGSVRRDVIQASVVKDVSDGSYKFKAENAYYPLETKADGSTYLEDYLNFLDHCAPLPRSYEEIEEIVLSGAEGYFNGQYSAERAAELIHNRVQLYLDEQK